MSISLSPQMNLPVPGVGTEAGPDYANDVNSCLTIVDAHDHTAGSGVQITPQGLNINSDLSFGSNNATDLRTLRLSPQAAVLSSGTDIGCLYEVGVDLYYNDGNGNQVRITQSGAVAGTPGSISSLTSPASASYSSAASTFIFQSAALTPANIDGASYILRNLVASSKGLTLAPPNSMAADYTLTLPALPASTLPVQLSASGAFSTGTISYAQLDSGVQTKITGRVPSVQRITSGSGTYTTPANVLYLKVRVAGGGGGGGAGNGGGAAAGSVGSVSTFSDGTHTITAGAGAGGVAGNGVVNSGAAGGANTIGSLPANTTVIMSVSGGSGQGPFKSTGAGSVTGGCGGNNPLGGGAGGSGGTSGLSGAANTGGGGAGGGGDFTSNVFGGGGGGAGGYVEFYISSPLASYTYAVGAGGAGGTGGLNGGAGGSGVVIVEEYYY